jgi:hypothetical protein
LTNANANETSHIIIVNWYNGAFVVIQTGSMFDDGVKTKKLKANSIIITIIPLNPILPPFV